MKRVLSGFLLFLASISVETLQTKQKKSVPNVVDFETELLHWWQEQETARRERFISNLLQLTGEINEPNLQILNDIQTILENRPQLALIEFVIEYNDGSQVVVTPLLLAILTGNIELLKRVAPFSNPNQVTETYDGALDCLLLSLALKTPEHNSFINIVLAELEEGIVPLNMEQRNAQQETPVTQALLLNTPFSIKLLAKFLQMGANPNTPDRLGVAPLLRAIQSENVNAQALLIAYGADVEATNQDGLSARRMIERAGNTEHINHRLKLVSSINHCPARQL